MDKINVVWNSCEKRTFQEHTVWKLQWGTWIEIKCNVSVVLQFFPLSMGMVVYANEFETKKIKF